MKHMHTPMVRDTLGNNIADTYNNSDARLIAAAPDLLAALEYWFDSKATPGEIARRARAAIAKARGED